MGVNDEADKRQVLVNEFNVLEQSERSKDSQLRRIRNVIEGPQDDGVKVALVQKVLEGH